MPEPTPGAKDRLSRLLEALSRRGSAPNGDLGADAARSDGLHRAALAWEPVPRLPIAFSWPDPGTAEFPLLPNGSIYRDPESMLYNELVGAFGLGIAARRLGGDAGTPGDDLAPCVRPNWGTVLVASILGGEAEQTGDHTPWIRRNEERPISLEAIAEADPDPASSGWMPRVLETYEAYRELLALWPELAAAIRITLPDLQGPLDTVEMLRGADLFIDLLDRPELAAAALRRAAEIQVACARLLESLTRESPAGHSHQHGFLVRGNILIRCDSGVMISPELYREVVAPADESLLSELGGGGMHSCGRIGHAVPAMLELPSILCLDFGQSFMNDIDALYPLARARRIPFLRVQPTPAELADGSILRRFPTGVSLHCPVASAREARELFDAYTKSAARTAQGETAK